MTGSAERCLLDQTTVWPRLQEHAARLGCIHLRDLFRDEPGRSGALSVEACSLFLDLSKQRVDASLMPDLLALAKEVRMREAIDAMFEGVHVNTTEDQPAGHWRLRCPEPQCGPEIQLQLKRMQELVEKVQSGHWRGCHGDAITTVVNLGVGGSDLGPLMVATALDEMGPPEGLRPEVHFVSSMDGSQLARLLPSLDAARTLFVISSKSFSTADTMSNAEIARSWACSALAANPETVLRCHFIGVSAKEDKMAEWGISEANRLHLWHWVGGRFSVWSAIGVSVALRIGFPAFKQLLAGAHQMDRHFREAALSRNLPVLAALVDVWNVNFLGITARAVLPYDARLKYLPAYLEQLEMESNGKSVSASGVALSYHTCPVIWGAVGTNAQHAFFQLLHQGTHAVASEFILCSPARDGLAVRDNRDSPQIMSAANGLAQSHLLAFGDMNGCGTADLHQKYRGNQVSSTLVLNSLSPRSLGAFLAFQEHRVYAQSVLWGVNPFDQWGVEQGKVMARAFQDLLTGRRPLDDIADESTQLLASRLLGLDNNH